jgi:membrane protein YqaA with SNARE-associated domain
VECGKILLTVSSYGGLFFISFLAATLLPLSSEVAVATMFLSQFNPVMILVAATAGNFSGALLNYGVGVWGDRFILSRYIDLPPQTKAAAKYRLEKYGAPFLFLAWLPVIGDPITVVAGVLRINLVWFTLWVATGKALRYAVVMGGAEAVINWLA